MNKAITYSRNGAIILALGNGIYNLIQQNRTHHISQPYNWNEFLKAAFRGGICGATGGFILGALRDQEMSELFEQTSGSAPQYLRRTLQSHTSPNLDIFATAENLVKGMNRTFSHELLTAPSMSGSVVKGTSINGSDIDIQLKFRNESGTLPELYDRVYTHLEGLEQKEGLINVRRQRHSIGLSYHFPDQDYRIDVIPHRSSNNGKGDSYLLVNRGIFRKPTVRKLNPNKQSRALCLTNKEKEMVRLLKIWKKTERLPIKSIYIELLVKRAFREIHISRNIDSVLLDILGYIAKNITSLRIVDPVNTNNIISNTLSCEEKEYMSRACTEVIRNVQTDKRNLIDYFPISVN